MDEHPSTPDSEHTIRGSNVSSHHSLRKTRLYDLGDHKHKASRSSCLNPAALPFTLHSPRESSTPGLVFGDSHPSQRFRPPPQESSPDEFFRSHTSTFVPPDSPDMGSLEGHDDCSLDEVSQVKPHPAAKLSDRKALICFVDTPASFHQTVLWCQNGAWPAEQSYDLWRLVPCHSSSNN